MASSLPNNSANDNLNATARPRKQYFCDCSRYCKGRRVQVSRPTYQRHAPFRQADVEKGLANFRKDDHLSTTGTLPSQLPNRIHQQLGRPMNGADIVQPRITVGPAGCGVSDDTTFEAQVPESDPSEVRCHSPVYSKIQQLQQYL